MTAQWLVREEAPPLAAARWRPRVEAVPSHRERGLTLAEWLVASALMVLVLGSLVAVFSRGMRVWARARRHAAFDQQLLLAFESMRQDLRSACRFDTIGFEGASETFTFPVLLTVGTAAEEPLRTAERSGVPQAFGGIGRGGFYLDSRRRMLCQARQPYEGLRSSSLRNDCDPLAEEVDRIRFEYFVPDRATDGFAWRSAWQSADPPLAVKVEIGSRGTGREPMRSRTMIVYLPMGRWVELDEDE